MTEFQQVRIIQFAIGLLSMWFVYSFMYKRTRADVMREDLFLVRDELFLHVARRGSGFDDPAYLLLRQAINGMIRTARFVSLTKLAIAHRLGNEDRPEDHMLLNAIRNVSDPEFRDHLMGVYGVVCRRARRYLLLEGPPALLFYPAGSLLLGVEKLGGVAENLKSWADRKIREAEASIADEFVDLGEPDDASPMKSMRPSWLFSSFSHR